MFPVTSGKAPSAVGPYSQAIRHGSLLFVSGQLPIDPGTGRFAAEDAAGQARQCIANIRVIAEAAGSSLHDTVKTVVMLTDIDDFAAVNQAYGEAFPQPSPARSAFQVAALPKGAKVEIEAIIAVND